MTGHSAFWDDLTRDLGDPEFEREYVAESILIADIDAAAARLSTNWCQQATACHFATTGFLLLVSNKTARGFRLLVRSQS